jgi:hypothetical protein
MSRCRPHGWCGTIGVMIEFSAPLPPPPEPSPVPLAPPAVAPSTVAATSAVAVPAETSSKTWARIGAVAALVIVIGSLGPWAKVDTVFGTISVNGTSGDGPLTIVAAGLVLAGFLSSVWVLRWVGAIGALVVGGYDLVNASSRFSDLNADNEFARASVAWGLWLVVAAAVVAIVASALTAEAQPRPLAGGRRSEADRTVGLCR